MDWSGIISTLVGLIAGIGGVGTIIYYRQNKVGATADAIQKLLVVVDSQQETFNKAIEFKDTIIDLKNKQAAEHENELAAQKREIADCRFNIANQARQIKGLTNKIAEFERRTAFAERNICLVEDCELREPLLGTFKYKGE